MLNIREDIDGPKNARELYLTQFDGKVYTCDKYRCTNENSDNCVVIISCSNQKFNGSRFYETELGSDFLVNVKPYEKSYDSNVLFLFNDLSKLKKCSDFINAHKYTPSDAMQLIKTLTK